MRVTRLLACLAAPGLLFGQSIGGIDLNALKQQVLGSGSSSVTGGGTLPTAPNITLGAQQPSAQDLTDAQAREALIQARKAKESGSARFASDLFDTHQTGTFITDGGVSEDYVLGPGDQIYLNATGSANFDFTAPVDGSGSLAIPKVGNAHLAGMSVAQARSAVQSLVESEYKSTHVNMQVVQLREIRISILGEVYVPGSFLVPSLASLVNVLSLSGGPTNVGSYRDIRVVRGGKVVYHLDLYPLRAEGIGNPDFALQSGDVVFVPLAMNQVVMEGAFRRVVHQTLDTGEDSKIAPESASDLQYDAVARRIQAIQAQLGTSQPTAATAVPALPTAPAAVPAWPPLIAGLVAPAAPPAIAGLAAPAAAPAMPLDEKTRNYLENQLVVLNSQLAQLSAQSNDDHRVKLDPLTGFPQEVQDTTTPPWIKRWRQMGIAPTMVFELRPGESLGEATAFAGGLMPEQASSTLTIRRKSLSGGVDAFTVEADPAKMAITRLQAGDIVSAMPQRETLDRVVSVEGWARVPGDFSRTDGLRVGDLLKRDSQVLPDTYQARGEIIRTLDDGTTTYTAFDVAKAVSGDPASNLALQNRDRIELYKIGDRRLPKLLAVSGPVAYPGAFQFHEGMRASDLIFRAGVLQKEANTLNAQISRVKDGKTSTVISLDLSKLTSSDTASPVGLSDDAVNPLLQPDDEISFFLKPGYKAHRLVRVDGQVARPGVYALDDDHETLSQLIAKAGGLTPDAMPTAGILLRQVGTASSIQALATGDKDPRPGNINAVLSRLNETKRNPMTGSILDSPILHDLADGDLNRLVVNFPAALTGSAKADVELQDGDQIILPRASQEAYVVGETASPFAVFKVVKGQTVRDVLRQAGGPTRNADTWNIRLMKADGRIIDSWVMGKTVEAGDAVIVPQRILRDSTWQENLQALTPLALMLNAVK